MSDDNFLVKLFDTLKDASDKNEEATKKLILQQLELVNHIKYMPIEDLKKALEDHAKDCAAKISSNKLVITETSGDVMNLLRIINAKITKMFIIVTVAVSIATGGYFLIRYAADTNDTNKAFQAWEERHEKIESDQEKAMDEKLNNFMNEIRNEMNKLHYDGDEEDESVHK